MLGLFQIPPAGVAFISKFDPALSEAVDWTSYLRTFDPQYQPVTEGKVATKFYLKRLTLKQWEAVRSLPPHLQDKAAVSYGLANVDGFMKPNGQPLACSFTGDGEERRLDYDTLSGMYSPHLFSELGTVITVLSGLDPLVGAR